MKEIKLKIQLVEPGRDMVDVWRLFKSSTVHEPWVYPSLEETNDDDMRAEVIRYTLQNPNFIGVIARSGKRPIGQIIGNVVHRPIGKPNHYFFIFNFWVEPEFRKKGVMKQLFPAMMEELKKRGIFNWESFCTEKLGSILVGYKGHETKFLSHRIGGKI